MMYNSAEEVRDYIVIQVRCNAPYLDERVIEEIGRVVEQNPFGNSFNDTDTLAYRTDAIFNNGLSHIPKEHQDIQERYLGVAVYFFENVKIEQDPSHPTLRAFTDFGYLCHELLNPSEFPALTGNSPVFVEVIEQITRLYEIKKGEAEQDLITESAALGYLDKISKKLTDLYFCLEVCLKQEDPTGLDELAELKEIEPDESRFKEPEMVRKIWEYVKDDI